MSEVSLSLPAENSTGKCVKSIMQWVDALFSFLFLQKRLIRKVTRVVCLFFFFVIRKAIKIVYENLTVTFQSNLWPANVSGDETINFKIFQRFEQSSNNSTEERHTLQYRVHATAVVPSQSNKCISGCITNCTTSNFASHDLRCPYLVGNCYFT